MSRVAVASLFVGTGLLAAYLALRTQNSDIPDLGPVKHIDELVVNLSSEYRTLVRQSEEEGQKQLQRLARTSRIEESWMFLPEANEWYETGLKQYNETIVEDGKFQDQYTVDLNSSLIEHLLINHDHLVEYHFHPSIGNYFRESLPSVGDIKNMVDLSLLFRRSKEGVFKSKVVSQYGVTTYQLTEKAVAEFDDTMETIERFAKSRFALASKLHRAQLNEDIILKRPPLNRAEMYMRIRRLAKAMSNDYIQVTFKPLQ